MHTRTTSTTRMRTTAARARSPTRIGMCTSPSFIRIRTFRTCITGTGIEASADQTGRILKFNARSASQTSATARTMAEPPDMTSFR